MWRFYLWLSIRRSERRRLLFLFLTPILLYTLIYILSPREPNNNDLSKWEALLDSVEVHHHQLEQTALMKLKSRAFFYTDTCDISCWKKLGLSESDARRISNYIAAGGRVDEGDDLERLNIGSEGWRQAVGPLLLKKRTNASFSNNSWHQRPKHAPTYLLDPREIDINKPDTSILIDAGWPAHVVRRWNKYTESGGRFEAPYELLKLYGMDSAWVMKWQDSLIVDPLIVDSIDLNSKELYEVLTHLSWHDWQIEKLEDYRNRLGGFTHTLQLYEAGLDSLTLEELFAWSYCSRTWVQLSMNESTLSELALHPYITWEMAKELDYYRTHLRPIENLEELVELGHWDQQSIERLKDYLKR